ncbi:hypothetical protein BDP27DRAFT_1321655 [Rhodocollybia butyracea]|uniref:Uncharacterized protein n=1 Tax=Rhodocollybia butyracea TaxID=206335 RepID=A0A9P5UA27_9AGAR|nr:hypothetical protein BDP27DRAFT_1321655 [Rhodocollybia butyracea]
MAIGDLDFLQEDALSQLSRSEIQKLGKTHNIKANLKSISIIAQLLEKFPEGVPSPKSDAQPLPMKSGRTKKGAPKKKRQAKKEESVDASSISSTREDGPSKPNETAVVPLSPSLDAVIPATTTPAQSSTLRISEEQTSTDNAQVPPPSSVGPLSSFKPRSSPHCIPWPERPNRFQTREERDAPPLIPEPAVEVEAEDPSNVPDDEDSNTEIDNLSEISEFSHNPSESSAGDAEDTLATDEQIKRVLDIVRRNREEDLALHEKVKRSLKKADTAKELLHEQLQKLQAEREHRERIITFFLYHVQNNNRWTGDPEKMAAKVYEKWHTNDGRGWKDMGEWEWDEVWSGPIVVAPNGVEVAPSNEEEFLRNTWKDEQLRRDAVAPTAETTPKSAINPNPSASPSRKRKSVDLSEVSDKRQRLEPITEDPRSSPPAVPRQNKGKGKMSPGEVERLAHRERTREGVARSLRELDGDEEDSAEAYQIQQALVDSLLVSAEATVEN